MLSEAETFNEDLHRSLRIAETNRCHRGVSLRLSDRDAVSLRLRSATGKIFPNLISAPLNQ
ncbi:MAG: hypothetical protein ABJB16_04925 [Saprospiraceae bacterium]